MEGGREQRREGERERDFKKGRKLNLRVASRVWFLSHRSLAKCL